MAATKTARLNWRVLIECLDCGARFEVQRPNPSVEVFPGTQSKRARMVVIGCPNECPECRNLRVVRDEAPSPAGEREP